MNKYELITIIDAQLPQDEKDAIFKQTTDAIVKGGAKVINGQVWQEKYKMAFSIKKCQEGTYYLINFESAGPALSSVRELLRLNENLLRFGIYNSTGF